MAPTFYQQVLTRSCDFVFGNTRHAEVFKRRSLATMLAEALDAQHVFKRQERGGKKIKTLTFCAIGGQKLCNWQLAFSFAIVRK